VALRVIGACAGKGGTGVIHPDDKRGGEGRYIRGMGKVAKGSLAHKARTGNRVNSTRTVGAVTVAPATSPTTVCSDRATPYSLVSRCGCFVSNTNVRKAGAGTEAGEAQAPREQPPAMQSRHHPRPTQTHRSHTNTQVSQGATQPTTQYAQQG
jgi:hypothetical protein